MRLRSTPICFLAVLALSFASCDGPNGLLKQYENSFGAAVTAPRSDQSPPTVSLVLPDLGNGKQTPMNGQPPVTINITPQNNGFFIVGVGDDPQGLKSLAFTGASGLTCQMGNTAYQQDGDLAGPQYQNKAVAGQTTTTRLWLPTYIDFSNYACQKHYKITSLSIALWGGSHKLRWIKRHVPGRHIRLQPLTSLADNAQHSIE